MHSRRSATRLPAVLFVYSPKAYTLDATKQEATTMQNTGQTNEGVTLSTLPELATPNEWAEAFNVSMRTVYRMCEDGELKTVKVRGSIRICRDLSFALLGLS